MAEKTVRTITIWTLDDGSLETAIQGTWTPEQVEEYVDFLRHSIDEEHLDRRDS